MVVVIGERLLSLPLHAIHVDTRMYGQIIPLAAHSHSHSLGTQKPGN